MKNRSGFDLDLLNSDLRKLQIEYLQRPDNSYSLCRGVIPGSTLSSVYSKTNSQNDYF